MLRRSNDRNRKAREGQLQSVQESRRTDAVTNFCDKSVRI
jgi:hypothetical protein